MHTIFPDRKIRLRGGEANSGRIEMRYNDSFWAVCIDGFNIKMADVVCRQLGFRHGALGMGPVDGFSFATLDTSLDTILFSSSCVGNENNFDECIDVTWSERTCSMDRQVAMFCALPYYEGCYESSTPVGIADDSQTLHGLVGLCRIFRYDYAGSSKTVGDSHRCGNSLSEFGTLVDDSFCAELCGNDPYQLCGGIGAYRAVYSTLLGSTGYTLTNDSGSITSYNYPGKYAANDHQVWEVTFGSTHRVQITFPAFNINVDEVITISAGGKNETFNSRRTWISDPISSFVVRFESRSSGTGFIMNYVVYIPNMTTTKMPVPITQQVTTSTQNATAMTSNQAMSTADLGMADSATVVPPLVPPQVPPAETTTTHRTTTSDEKLTPDVRIVNGLTPREGRVEIRLNGVWGTICDEYLSFNDAIVVCRSLGFTGALGTTSYSEFGPSFGNIHLDNFGCDGTEADIMECLRTIPDPRPQCLSSFREAGVRCSDCRDVHPLCIPWAIQGACESYPGDVLPVCQNSCNQCDIFGKNDSAPSLPLENTCVLGHCYVDENNASMCIPAVDICFTIGWYQGLICLPTPVKPAPSTVRCMSPDEHALTNLPVPELIEALIDPINELEYTTTAVDTDAVIALDRLATLLTNLGGLRLLPQHIYDRQNQASVVGLYGLDLHHVEDNAFTGFSNLRTLILKENVIREIRKGAFTGLHQLQYLNVRQNEIFQVENGSFADLRSLLFMEFGFNNLVQLQPGAFSGLINLRSLGLSNNMVRRIEEGLFGGMQNLQFLHLQSNNISDIEVGSFSDLQNLQLLNLSSNSIHLLKNGVFSGLSSLRYLDLINNHIQSIDGFTFENLGSLQFL
nr:soluble scavenger receptor cysteine-rich domain-containing protein SSC5D-like [Lytechinus pictus]